MTPDSGRRTRLLYLEADRSVDDIAITGGEVLIRIHVAPGGKICADSKVTVDKFPLVERRPAASAAGA